MEPSIGIIHLSEDLIIEILLRLPVKSLLRFRSLSKRWQAIISAADFIDRHFQHQSNNTRLLVNWSTGKVGDVYVDLKSCFSVFASNLDRIETPDYLELPWHVGSILGPCKGIFCLYVEDKKLALWNPATRRLMPLPFSFSDPEDFIYLPRFLHVNHHFAHGFGIDLLTDELKIVVFDHSCSSNKFAVYRSSSRIPWIFKYSDKLRIRMCTLEDPAFVNGFIYWRRTRYLRPYSDILAFDLHNEVFEVIQMPEAISSREYGQLDSYDDSLVVFSSENNGPGFYTYDCFDIWTMKKKGNWTKLRTVVMPCATYTPLGFWNRNKICVYAGGKLLVYDPETQSVTNLIVEKKGDPDNFILTSYYKESLASVKGDHELQDYDIMSAVSRDFFTLYSYPPKL